MSRLSPAGSRLDIYIHIQNMYTYAERQSYGKMNVLLAMKKRNNSSIEAAVLRSTTTMSNGWLL